MQDRNTAWGCMSDQAVRESESPVWPLEWTRVRPMFSRVCKESMGVINHRLSSIVPLVHVVFYTLILTAQVSSASPNVSARWTVSEEGRRTGERIQWVRGEHCGTNYPQVPIGSRDSGTDGTAAVM